VACVNKVLSIAAKTTKELVRNRRSLLLALGLPVAFMLIFGFAFGGGNDEITYDVVVLNQDRGALSAQYLGALRGLAYEDGTRMFALENATTLDEGLDAVTRGDAAMLLVLPQGFSGSQRAAVAMHGDPSSVGYQTAAGIAEGTLLRFNGNLRLTAQRQAVTGEDLSAFDFIAPGLMVFAIVNMAPQAASTLTREVENHTLTRLRLTRARAWEILGGVSLGQMAVSLLALVLMFLAAALMGFHFGGPGQVGLAVLVALVSALAVMGIGMVIASFARKTEQAAGLGVLVAVPASFLSGAFFPIPEVDLFRVGDRVVQIYDILPTTHAVRAMRKVLTFGQGPQEVAFELAALLVLSVLFFLLGVVLYRRAHLRPT
jgi:ABC-2 type transport system permease protein